MKKSAVTGRIISRWKLVTLAAIITAILITGVKTWHAVTVYHEGQLALKTAVITQALQLRDASGGTSTGPGAKMEQATRLLTACGMNEDSTRMVNLLFSFVMLLSFIVVGLCIATFIRLDNVSKD